MSERDETCIDCGGTGQYPSGQPCKCCGGSGRVAWGDGVESGDASGPWASSEERCASAPDLTDDMMQDIAEVYHEAVAHIPPLKRCPNDWIPAVWAKIAEMQRDAALRHAEHISGECMAAEQERDAALAREAVLRGLLTECLDWMERGRASGDCGFWEWEPDDEYSRARAAITGGPADAR